MQTPGPGDVQVIIVFQKNPKEFKIQKLGSVEIFFFNTMFQSTWKCLTELTCQCTFSHRDFRNLRRRSTWPNIVNISRLFK